MTRRYYYICRKLPDPSLQAAKLAVTAALTTIPLKALSDWLQTAPAPNRNPESELVP
ncbi:MAG: hypothetical protein NZM04_00420 [Methylacidiphilales bacterium]|nr:hypothetical protein [Candidatus Methylacidiphilales bacterium]